MREVSVPSRYDVPATINVADIVFEHAEKYPTEALYALRSGADWTDLSAAEFAGRVNALAKGFIAAGIEPGSRVALMSRTRFEWTLCDFALASAGLIVVPIYETSSADQVEWILSNSGATAAIVETAEHAAIVEQVRGALTDLKTVWVIDNADLDTLVESGTETTDDEVSKRRGATKADDVATIVYTSGTTGRPKGCQLTHRNLVFDARNTVASQDDLLQPGRSTLLFLPLAHVFARIIQLGALTARVKLGHSSDIPNLVPDLGVFKPSFLLAVPRVFEKVYNSAAQKAISEGKGKIFHIAEATAIEYSRALDKGTPGLVLKLKHAVFDKLVYGKLRAALGGRCESAVSGGAPLGDRLGHFFRGIGITVLEGYGLTETSPVTASNTLTQMRVGTVGRPLPGATIRIADDGEIIISGEHVFSGYWGNEEATKETLIDGWLHTGDLGSIDEDGYVSITGRKKEIIVTAGGKNVAPAALEDALRSHALISQCIVVGDQRPFVGALITIDEEMLPAWKKNNNKPADATLSDLINDPDLHAQIQQAVNSANKTVSKAESIRKFIVLDNDFNEDNGYLTPSMKLRRNVVREDFSAQIDQLYAT
ncbi:long-chain acyl-CoA synthetase [Antricoccus suffuscus]|uniref:Acyl-CoA synthetase n=1 Tax=Antricoccus suffuscus TaxID=1629062 RepID=A0A2T0ZZ59_9ACTN|nr:AMP-dependent synthetase/ligase [Antricoccus suffuscus]PRZ41368.1 long-chain acyl-CoA synthetase [Antricoccus suffuscus]